MPDLTDCFHLPCHSCMQCKSKRRKQPKKAKRRADAQLDRVYADHAGPFKCPLSGGAYYMLLFCDDHSRKKWIYLSRTRGLILGLVSTILHRRGYTKDSENRQLARDGLCTCGRTVPRYVCASGEERPSSTAPEWRA